MRRRAAHEPLPVEEAAVGGGVVEQAPGREAHARSGKVSETAVRGRSVADEQASGLVSGSRAWARARAHPVRTMRRCLLEICLRAIPSCRLPSTCVSSVSGMRCCAGSITDACRSGLGFR
eukprot:scaffold69873_cov51-Phaeocystis_antarctica.AAC.2